eukprot:SAG22_NODE_11799_length_468_cov_1.661247_1_plen_43_part_10
MVTHSGWLNPQVAVHPQIGGWEGVWGHYFKILYGKSLLNLAVK